MNSLDKTTRTVFSLLLLSLLISCTPPALLTPSEKGQAPVVAFSPLWEKFKKASDVRGTLQAFAQIDMQAGDDRHHLKAALLLKRPALMRLENIPLFGPPDFFLTLNEKSLKIFFPGKKEFYLARPRQEDLAHFLPVSMPPADLVAILLGLPPPLRESEISFREAPGNAPRLELLAHGEKIQTLWLTSDGEHLTDMEIFAPGGETIYRINYGSYRQLGNSRLPEKVTIVAEEKKIRMVVDYREMELNMAGDEAIFDLPIPADTKLIVMDNKDTPTGNGQ